MTDTKRPYIVRDRRRVGLRGQRHDEPSPKGLRQVNFKEDLREPIDSAFRYFRAQLEHTPKATWPRSGQTAALLYGYLLSSQQLYASTILLMADNLPKPLVLPAGIVARALLEGLGNLLALLEDPSVASPLFLKDDYLNTHRRGEYQRKRFGSRPGYEREARKLTQYGQALALTAPEIAQAEEHLKEWPTPGRLLRRTMAPRLTGERSRVFKEVFGFWYRSLSAFAHHRLCPSGKRA